MRDKGPVQQGARNESKVQYNEGGGNRNNEVREEEVTYIDGDGICSKREKESREKRGRSQDGW